MEEEKKTSYGKRRWPGAIYGTAVLGILAALGWFFWAAQDRPSPETPLTTPVAIQAVGFTPTNTPPPLSSSTPRPSATAWPQPATLTPLPTTTPTSVPTRTPTVTPSATPLNTATPTPLPATWTATATHTPLSAPAPGVTGSPETAVPSASAPLPWPTTDPTLLRKPPAGIDLSRTHIWFSRPVDGNNTPSTPYRFGMTYNQRLAPHRAVDISNPPGTPVVAVGPGTIYYAGEDIETLFGPRPDFYGRLVVLEMDQKWEGRTVYALYGHLESVAVATGDRVSAGDVVGAVGQAGVALGPHLHFEIRQDRPNDYDSVRNPELWYWPYTGRGVLAGRVVDVNGTFMPGVRVNLECSDAAPRYVETYWDRFTPPDDVLVENFVISDLPAGTCRVWVDLLGEVVEQTVEIAPGELSTVVLQR